MPKLLLWADGDPPAARAGRRRPRINAPEPEIIPNAGHFLQEDQGELIGKRIAQWLDETPIVPLGDEDWD